MNELVIVRVLGPFNANKVAIFELSLFTLRLLQKKTERYRNASSDKFLQHFFFKIVVWHHVQETIKSKWGKRINRAAAASVSCLPLQLAASLLKSCQVRLIRLDCCEQDWCHATRLGAYCLSAPVWRKCGKVGPHLKTNEYMETSRLLHHIDVASVARRQSDALGSTLTARSCTSRDGKEPCGHAHLRTLRTLRPPNRTSQMRKGSEAWRCPSLSLCSVSAAALLFNCPLLSSITTPPPALIHHRVSRAR